MFLLLILDFLIPKSAFADNTLLGGASTSILTDPKQFFSLSSGGYGITFIRNLANMLSVLAAIVAISMVIWGWVVLVTAAGNPEKVKQARQIFTAAAIGGIILIAAQLIIFWVVKAAGGAI